MESFFTSMLLFGGAIFWTWAVLISFVVICLIADLAKNGFWATFALVLLGAVYYFFGANHGYDILAHITAAPIIGYLLIGLAYATIRTFIEGAKLGKRILKSPTYEEYLAKKGTKDYINESDTREYKIKRFKQELKGNISRWWLLWWISAITWLIGYLLKDLWDVVYNWMKNFFNYILEMGIRTTLGKFASTKPEDDDD
jgi:hypothetical protein